MPIRSLPPCLLAGPLLAGLLLALPAPTPAATLGTAFSYQGVLRDGGQPATGLYDLQVCLYDDPVAAPALACAPDFDDLPVEDGLFSVELDFGAAFDGQERWLELRVRAGADTGSYTVLSPRQLIRPTPEALHASAADSAATATTATTATAASTAPWSGLSGVPAGFDDDIDNDSGGTVTSISAGTGLDGGTITNSGSIAIAVGGVGSTQIDSSQVQRRVSGSCTIGHYLRGIAEDGSVSCEPLPGFATYSTVAPGGVRPSIAFGPGGVPVIAHGSSSEEVFVTRCGNGACSAGNQTHTIAGPTAGIGGHQSIAIGQDGLPVVAFAGTPGLWVVHCGNEDCSAGNTTAPIVAGGVDWPSIAVNSDGHPVISYHLLATDKLVVAVCGDADCSNAGAIVQTELGSGGEYGDIAIGSDGFAVVSYQNSSAELAVAHCGNASCTSGNSALVVDSDVALGYFSSIIIGSDGYPFVAHTDFGPAHALTVTHCSSVDCQGMPAPVSTPVDATQGGSIFLGAARLTTGQPLIAYQTSNDGVLRVYRCNTAVCDSGGVSNIVEDPAGNTDASHTVGIGPDGWAVIAYTRNSNSLRVVRCETRDCQ